MSESQDQILARELGKIGSVGGRGGSSGASFAARFLPTETFNASLRIEAGAAQVLQTVFRILAGLGQITDKVCDRSGGPCISAIVGSGFLKMNPTLIHIQIASASEHACDLTIAAAAKEGLIKQRSAEKAVKRLREELSKVYSLLL